MTRRLDVLLLGLSAILSGCAAQASAVSSTGSADTASVVTGVVFVHGTATYTQQSAVTDYWTQASVTTMSGGLPYLAVGYHGDTCAAFDECAWGDVASQIDAWMSAEGVGRIVIVTHSNGSNVVRFMVHHPTASDAVQRVVAATGQVVFLAGDNTGTPLADEVTEGWTFASAVNSVLDTFGFGTYDNPAVWQQRTDSMSQYDTDGTFDDENGDRGGATLADLVPVVAESGTTVYAVPFTTDADCGGYADTAGLVTTLVYGWGAEGCADGFVGCDSSRYVGFNADVGLGLGDDRLNHNQSRLSCHGVGDWVASQVGQASSATTSALSLRTLTLATGSERMTAHAARSVLPAPRPGPSARISRAARVALHAGVATGIAVDHADQAELVVLGSASTEVAAPGGSRFERRLSRIAGANASTLDVVRLDARDAVGTYTLRSPTEGVALARFPASPIALALYAPERGERSLRVAVIDAERPVDTATVDAELMAPDGRTRARLAVHPDGVGAWRVDLGDARDLDVAEGTRHVEVSVHGTSRGAPFDRFGTAAVAVARRAARVVGARIDACDGDGCSVGVDLEASRGERQEITVRLMDDAGRLVVGRGQSSLVLPPGTSRHILRIPAGILPPAGARIHDVRVYSVSRHALVDRWVPTR